MIVNDASDVRKVWDLCKKIRETCGKELAGFYGEMLFYYEAKDVYKWLINLRTDDGFDYEALNTFKSYMNELKGHIVDDSPEEGYLEKEFEYNVRYEIKGEVDDLLKKELEDGLKREYFEERMLEYEVFKIEVLVERQQKLNFVSKLISGLRNLRFSSFYLTFLNDESLVKKAGLYSPKRFKEEVKEYLL